VASLLNTVLHLTRFEKHRLSETLLLHLDP